MFGRRNSSPKKASFASPPSSPSKLRRTLSKMSLRRKSEFEEVDYAGLLRHQTIIQKEREDLRLKLQDPLHNELEKIGFRIRLEELGMKECDIGIQLADQKLHIGLINKIQKRSDQKSLHTERVTYQKSRFVLECNERELLSRQSPEHGENTSAAAYARLVYDAFLGDKVPEVVKFRKKRERIGTKQSKFRSDLIEDYGSTHPEMPKYLWCPVNKEYFHKDQMKAAHIIPHALPDEYLEDLTGLGSSKEKMRSSNGLMINKQVEQAFDQGNILITRKGASETGLDEYEIFMVQDVQLGERPGQVDVKKRPFMASAVHGTTMQFLTDFRPRKRFMFLKLVMMRAKAIRNPNVSLGTLELVKDLGKRSPWPTIGPYLARSRCLRDVSEYYGIRWEEALWEDCLNARDQEDEGNSKALWTEKVSEAYGQRLASGLAAYMDPDVRKVFEEEDSNGDEE